MSLAFVPIYIDVLGIEVYGLIGFFLSLQAFFLIFDMGLSTTLNRELARRTHSDADADEKRDLVRTLECVYWLTGLLIAVSVFALSTPMATYWLKPVTLSVQETAHAIALMGLATAIQWPSSIYAGGLRGLERQVALNGLNSLFATLRSAGVVLVIVYYSPTIDAFLWWQVVVGAIRTFASAGLLWHLLPGNRPAIFNSRRLYEVRNFAMGMTGIVVASFLLQQSDRFILSALLPLNEFGYYSLAASIAAALSAVVLPFFNALYPRFSGMVAAGDKQKLIILYHHSNQLLTVIVASVASVTAFFAVDLLRLWTHNSQLADKSGPILSILVIGTALNGLMNIPYALQLAHGWTRLALYQNVAAIPIAIPAIWWLGHHVGGVGAAVVWAALNFCYVTIGIPLMHRKLLSNEMRAWYMHDILPPTLAAIACAATIRLSLPTLPEGLHGITALGIIGLTTLGATVMTTAATRSYAFNIFRMLTKVNSSR